MGEALAASVDGQGTLGPGSRADIALLDHDPLAERARTFETANAVRRMTVAATFVAGRKTFGSLIGS